jgi:hypothetical protein
VNLAPSRVELLPLLLGDELCEVHGELQRHAFKNSFDRMDAPSWPFPARGRNP